MESSTYKWFKYEHLPVGKARDVSAECAMVAKLMEDNLQSGPEKSAGMRKLLEAKDCFVRQAIEDAAKG